MLPLTEGILTALIMTVGVGPGMLINFRDLFKNFLSGFIVNISNPFVFIFWMTLMSIASLNFGFRTQSFHIYFAAVIFSALCLDITKSYFFSRFRSGIKENFMKLINIGTGTVLAFSGVAIICRSIFIIHQPLFP